MVDVIVQTIRDTTSISIEATGCALLLILCVRLIMREMRKH